MRTVILAALGIIACIPAPAHACLLPLREPYLEGETDKQYRDRLRRQKESELAAFQRNLLTKTDQVFIARISERGFWKDETDKGMFHDKRDTAKLEPLSWLKGEPGAESYEVRTLGANTCGIEFGGGDAVRYGVGTLVVVFVQTDVEEWRKAEISFAFERIHDRHLIKMLKKAGYPPSPIR